MSYKIARVPKNYQGLEPTGRQIKDLLVPILEEVHQVVQHSPNQLIEAWPTIVGEKVASMTKAVSIEGGVFLIKVQNSTLYSLLSQHEKPRLLKIIQETFPTLKIRNIVFRIG